MRTGIVGITALGLALTTSTTIASAQVHASVVVVAAPPVTRVHVAPPVISYRPRPIVVIGRPANRVIYVERVAWREPKWWKRRGYRPVRFWYDGQRFYDRPVRIYGVAKTLADCFKYRNKIGLDVALEALREAWRYKRFTMEELHRYAVICRVERVMRPYLELLVA